jgi:signal transduction histidine kinase
VPYRSIEDPVKLRRVLEATLLLEADLDLASLLRHIVEEARSMTGASYAALGVLNDERTALTEFITVGIDPDQEQRIGARPTGRGVLGLLITDPRPLRLSRLGSHGESYGFPDGHPPMTSFLGVPITVRDEVYGNLYLTDKVGWSEFTADDESLVGALAVAAGIAIQNARLHQLVQDVAVYEERDRLARDLHDTVIQRLFAIGLTLQSLAGSPDAAGVSERLGATITDVDETIRQVRTSIFELGAGDGESVRMQVVSLIRQLSEAVGFDVRVMFDGPIDTSLSPVIAEHLLAVTREAVANVGRHAQASRAAVYLTVDDRVCQLRVVDNGRGTAAAAATPAGGSQGGLGLNNMKRRADKLGGVFTLEDDPGGGTVLTWQVPLER